MALGRLTGQGRLVGTAGRPMTASGRLYTAQAGNIVDPYSPLYYANTLELVVWLRADQGITLGGTLRATGTAPPAWTISGTATRQVGLHMEIDSVAGGTGLGQATYKWSENNGTTYIATGVVTAAGPTALGTTGLSVAQAVGPYNIDNKWDATVSAWADQSGLGNHATQATAANQPLFSLAGYGGVSCVDWESGSAGRGLDTGSVSLGAYTIMSALRCDSGARYALLHNTDAGDTSFIWTGNNTSSYTTKSGVGSGWNVGAGWVNDGVRRTVAATFNGRHDGHQVYKNAVAQTLVDTGFTSNPGTAATSGPFRLGKNQTTTFGYIGALREVIVFNRAASQSVLDMLHAGIVERAAGAI